MRLLLTLLCGAALLLAACTSSADLPESTSTEKPDDNRFTPVVLTSGPTLDEPMAFEVLDDGRVILIERKGGVKLFHPTTREVTLMGTIDVNTKYTSAEGEVREAEEGLVGLAVQPDFEENPWIYLLYADPDSAQHVFARWTVRDGKLDESSKVVLFDFPVQREVCCHTGGGTAWDDAGNLYLTIGNNTGNSRASQTDERPGRSSWDDQRGAANTNDLRGKIIRIHPEADGSYTIPEGNLFPPGTPNTRPEIYTMGHRNAWRVSWDSETGAIYWGEVGPDATDDTEIGPRGYDELNQAKSPGNYGWPYFIGENHAYPVFDYAADVSGEPKDPDAPVNTSVNNTGLEDLPPARPALISYPYGVSERFPEVGSGSRSIVGGPVYHRADFDNPERPFPAYYEDKLLVADFSRGWIMAITVDEDGEYVSMERFLPDYEPVEIIDLKFGPEGDLYLLEYGSRWFQDSDNDRLVRIEYNAGNRTPVVVVSADRTGGAVPFEASLSADGTVDYDGDELTYEWVVAPEDGIGTPRTFAASAPTVLFDAPGVYTATLTVRDPDGASNSQAMTIVAGNEPPDVDLGLDGNRTFFFPDRPIRYDVSVSDREDGSLADGQITPGQVAVSMDYVSEGFDFAEVMQAQRSVDLSARHAVGEALMASSDCAVCHQPEIRSAGPALREIAEKYRGDPEALERLAQKVITGGSGVWGEIVMPAHPQVTPNDARLMVASILEREAQTIEPLPIAGRYTPAVPEGDNGLGTVVLRAAYTDRGVDAVPPLTGEEVVILRSATVDPGRADALENAETSVGRGAGPVNVLPRHGGHLLFRGIDLTGISGLEVMAQASERNGTVGGTVEVYAGSPDGQLLGRADVKLPDPVAPRSGPGGGFRRFRPDPVPIDLTPTRGMQDLFFVFKNDTARAIDPLMSVSAITFVHE